MAAARSRVAARDQPTPPAADPSALNPTAPAKK
jgi:hypothetical protein